MKHTARILTLATLWIVGGCGSDEPTPCDRTVVGNICTIVGNGENAYSGDEGPATRAEMSLPQDTLTTPDGTLYILDWNNHRIRKVTTDGIIHHVAGRGELGGTLDDPVNSDFNHPTGLLLDAEHDQMIISAWHNSKIRVLDLATGELTDSCGDGRRAYFGDESPALTASLDLPASIAFDPEGNLVVMDQANQVIRSIDSQGFIHRIAGQCVIDRPPPEGPGACADGTEPVACAAPSGKTTCGDPLVDCSKPCNPGYGGDEGPALEARLAQPFGQSADPGGRLLYEPDGSLVFADTSNAMIRRIDPDGVIHPVAGVAPVDGVAQTGYSGDGGPALEAELHNPVDLARSDDGTLYFTDVYNHCVRAIDPDGTIHAVVGVCGQPGYDGDGGPAGEALLKRPYGLEWVDGVLYVSDTGNNVIRAVRLR